MGHSDLSFIISSSSKRDMQYGALVDATDQNGLLPFPSFDALSNKCFSAQSGISVTFRLTCWPMLKRPNVGSWDLEGSALRCQSAGLIRPSVRMPAAADTVAPCTKPQVYVERPPNAGFGFEPVHVRNWNGECTFSCLTQRYDSDAFEHDGVQQVGATEDVDQVLNGPWRDVLGDTFQGRDEALVYKLCQAGSLRFFQLSGSLTRWGCFSAHRCHLGS